jgi:hypothetical protein
LDELLKILDVALRTNHPSLHATLQPGIHAALGPVELETWFRWRNGQLRGTIEALHGTYRFVSYGEGRAELRHMRSTVWKSPLNAAIISVMEPKSFYSIPLIINPAGEGYHFDLLRRSMYYRFRGEPHVAVGSFTSFLKIVIEFASRPTMPPRLAAEYEYDLLQRVW